MRGEPKTQREILASLGDMNVQDRTTWLDRWKSKTLENRHVALLLIVIAFFGVVYSLMNRSTSPRTMSPDKESPLHHQNSAVHFSRDRPLESLVLNEIPPVELNPQEWDELMLQYDTAYQLIIVLSSAVSTEVVERLDGLLKKSGLVGTAPWGRATWFVAAQLFADVNGSPYYAKSPRLMLTGSFQSLVMGHQVELLTSTTFDQRLLARLTEGQGDVRTRLLFLPEPVIAQKGIQDRLAKLSPLICVSIRQTTVTVRHFTSSFSVVAGAPPPAPRVSSSTISGQDPCIIRPFDVADYSWNCKPLKPSLVAG